MKTTILIIVISIIVFAGLIYWSKVLESNDPDIISIKGLHWHPVLEIAVQGKKVEIPANLGIGQTYKGLPTFNPQMSMTDIHTHDDVSSGIIHLEFTGIVRKENIQLKNFFRIWGKDINSFGTNPRMTINGEPSTLFGEYEMKDGEKIVLNYE